jgi:hypothetical protein
VYTVTDWLQRVGPILYIFSATTVVFFVWARYSAARAACAQYVASASAVTAAAAAVARLAQQTALIAGLLPPHVLPHATLALSAGADEQRAQFSKTYMGVSVLQALLHVAEDASAGFAHAAAAWHTVSNAVDECGGGLLEMVQSTGDAFLIAGPFLGERAPDGVRVDVARRIVDVVHALQAQLACRFAAVATSGSATEALLGHTALTYRIFGQVVRESNALLGAAPDGTPSIAFAAESFRKQFSNYASRPAAVRLEQQGNMSVAYLIAGEYLADGARPAGDATAEAQSSATEHFHAPTKWRVRGVGITNVSVVRRVVGSGPDGGVAATDSTAFNGVDVN